MELDFFAGASEEKEKLERENREGILDLDANRYYSNPEMSRDINSPG
jgi:hypothetical protein